MAPREFLPHHRHKPPLLRNRHISGSRFTVALDSPLRQQIFNIAVTEIESVMQPHCILNHIGQESVTFIRMGACAHSPIVAQSQLTWRHPKRPGHPAARGAIGGRSRADERRKLERARRQMVHSTIWREGNPPSNSLYPILLTPLILSSGVLQAQCAPWPHPSGRTCD
jgi:hypothetical protein